MEDGLTDYDDESDDFVTHALGYLDYALIPAVLILTPILGLASFIYTVNDLV